MQGLSVENLSIFSLMVHLTICDNSFRHEEKSCVIHIIVFMVIEIIIVMIVIIIVRILIVILSTIVLKY